MTAVPRRQRVQIAAALGLLAGLRTFLVTWVTSLPRDFDQVWLASRAMLHGRDPYSLIGPGKEFYYNYNLFYPLSAAVAAVPLAPLPVRWAEILFVAIGGACFAWALMERGYEPLIGFMGAGMVFAAEVAQWSPLLAASLVIAPLGFLYAAKPTIGAALFAARPSWWPILGGVVLGGIAFGLQPHWLEHWRHELSLQPPTLGAPAPYLLPLLQPGGLLVLLALLRWRRQDARLLVAMALVPQTMLLYETTPLFLIPRTWKEAGLLVLLSYAVPIYVGYATHGSAEEPRYILESAKAITVGMYLPLTVMVLRRPNSADA